MMAEEVGGGNPVDRRLAACVHAARTLGAAWTHAAMQLPWAMTVERFLGGFQVVPAADVEDLEAVCARFVSRHAAAFVLRGAAALAGHPGYLLAAIRGRPEDVALVHRCADGDAAVAGGYVESFLWVCPCHRGRGLAAELVLAKSDVAGCPPPALQFTPAGLAAHRSAHRMAVTRALAEGYRVPAPAMASHPGFDWNSRAVR